MENLPSKKNEMLAKMSEMEFYPTFLDEQPNLDNSIKISFSKLAAMGTVFVPVASALQNIIGQGQSGLYWAALPNEGHLAALKDGRGFLGSVLSNANNQVMGQASFIPVSVDPLAVAAAATLYCIDMKLDQIQQSQQEILNFLVEKNKAELKANLLFLYDILNNYKYNWNNENYKSSNYTKVLDIKQESSRNIIFSRKQITAEIDKKSLLNTDEDIKKRLKKIQSLFEDYQIALYSYAFSSYLEIMLLENFESSFIDGVANKIEDYSFQYRELYTQCYTQFESVSKSSIQTNILKGLSSVSSITGKVIEKVPLISKSEIDETLIEAGNKLESLSMKRVNLTLQSLIAKQSSCVRPFVDNIRTVKCLYNDPIKILVDNENIYIQSESQNQAAFMA